MKSKIALFICLCFTTISIFGATMVGSGKITTKSFETTASEHIVLEPIKMQVKSSMFKYTCSIIIGNRNEVKITADDNLIDDLSFANRNKTITISYSGTKSLQPSKLHVDIYTNKLTSLKAQGICKIRLEGNLTSDKLLLDLSASTSFTADNKVNVSKSHFKLGGASSLIMTKANTGELLIDAGGGTKIELTGKSEKLTANITGASKAILNNFEADNISGGASGASVCSLYCMRSIVFRVVGASKTRLRGVCRSADFNVQGASSLNALDLKVSDAIVSCSGASSATVNVSRSLTADASGASSIKYKGDPSELSKKSRAASSVRKL